MESRSLSPSLTGFKPSQFCHSSLMACCVCQNIWKVNELLLTFKHLLVSKSLTVFKACRHFFCFLTCRSSLQIIQTQCELLSSSPGPNLCLVYYSTSLLPCSLFPSNDYLQEHGLTQAHTEPPLFTLLHCRQFATDKAERGRANIIYC